MAVTDQNADRVYVFHAKDEPANTFGSEGIGPGEFRSPWAVAFGPNGTMAVADTSNSRVQVFHANGTFDFEFGTDPNGDSHRAMNRPGEFEGAAGVAFWPNGTMAVADYRNGRVQVFHANGTFDFMFNATELGQLHRPGSIAIAPNGSMAVTEFLRHRVQVFHANGTADRWFGSFGSGEGQFDNPAGVAFGPGGIMAVGERDNHRVQVFHANGTFDFEFGSFGSGPGEFNRTRGVAFGPGGIIAAVDSYNDRVQVFHANGTFDYQLGPEFMNRVVIDVTSTGVAFGPGGIIAAADRFNDHVQVFHPNGTLDFEFGKRGAGPGNFTNPDGVAFGPGGIIAVADAGNDRIQVFHANGTLDFEFGKRGRAGPGNFTSPTEVAFGPGGIIAVADLGGTVQVFHANGTFAHLVGSEEGLGCVGPCPVRDGPGEFQGPSGVAFGPGGIIAVADRFNDRIQVFHPNGTFDFEFGSSGTGGPDRPGASVHNGHGYFYTPTVRTAFGPGEFNQTASVAFGPGGIIAVADLYNHRIQVFHANGTFAYHVGQDDYINFVHGPGYSPRGLSPGDGRGQFNLPWSVAFGHGGTAMAVADLGNRRVQVFYVPTQPDTVAPSVTSVSSPNATGTYGIGERIAVDVNFTEPVVVAGAPVLAMETGDTDRLARYDSGNNSETLTFLYAVQPGDGSADLNYANASALAVGDNGGGDSGDSRGAIRDAAGNDADLVLQDPAGAGSLGRLGAIAIDGRPPEVLSATAEFRDRIRVAFAGGPVVSGGADASAGWSISGPDAGSLAVAGMGPIGRGGALTELVLRLDGHLPDTAPDIKLSYDASTGGIMDEAGNPLGGRTGIKVDDRMRPEIDEALIAGPRQVTIEYTENVTASPGAYSGLDIGGVGRALNPYDIDSALRLHVLAFEGAEAPVPEPPSFVTIDGRAVLDGADPGNALAERALTVEVRDGRVLEVFSSKIAGPDTVAIAYTRNAVAGLDAYSSLVVDGISRDITGLDGGEGQGHLHTLTFSPGGAPPNATGSVEIDGAAVAAASMPGMLLGSGGAIGQALADGQSPSVRSATAVSPDTIRVEFDEPVLAPGTGAAGGWSVSGRDAEGLAVVASIRNASEPSYSLALALDAPFPDTAPDAVTLSYRPALAAAVAGIADAAGNGLVASSTSVADGLAPQVRYAFVAGYNEAEVRYTEPVWAAPGAYASVVLSSGGGPRAVTGLAGNGTAVHTVMFGGDPATAAAAGRGGTTGVLEMDATAVIDAAMLPLGSDAAMHLPLAGEAPPSTPQPGQQPGSASARAVFTAGNTVTISYSAALGPLAGHEGPVYSAVRIDGETGGGARSVTGVSGLGTALHTVLFGGDGVDLNQTGTIVLAVDLEEAAAGGPPRLAAGEMPVAPGRTAHTVLLLAPQGQQGQQPPPVSIEPDGFARAIDGTAAGAVARLAINVTALAAASAAPGTATFPAEAVTLTAAFAEVTFPPGVTALTVPAGGAFYLHVDDADDAAAVGAPAALAYDNSGALVLRTVVEAGDGVGGDGDGDGGARIAFDRPVRVSLEGQAGGRAFYIEGADGAIVPIDLACAADDTERVHRQLGGSGECRIESDDGEDMVVHTYHLTRFGTAASERGTPPPVQHTCSLRLGHEDLAMRVEPGAYSNAAEQSVANTGSQPFARVWLEATPWYVDPASDVPDPGAASLPASLTMVGTSGPSGGFAPLSPGGSAAVAEGLGGGALPEPLWFMLDLTGHPQLQGGKLVQRITYTAECGAAATG